MLRNSKIPIYSQVFITIRSIVMIIHYLLYTSMNTHFFAHILARLLAVVLSYLYRESLRDRVYRMEQRIELLETAIDDIARINSAGADDQLIKGITDRLR